MSQAGKAVSGGGGGGSGITTINGDQGSPVTPTAGVVKISGQFAGASISFYGGVFVAPNELDLITSDGNNNTFLGLQCGKASDSELNTAIGYAAMTSITEAIANVSIGAYSLGSNGSGNGNIAIGYTAMSGMASGSSNVAIGTSAGGLYNANEQSNILINNAGVTGESNTLRIGAGTGTGDQQLNAAFISGINGATVTGSAVLIDTNGQMGTIVSARKFKENITLISDSVSEKIYALKPSTFTIKDKPDMHMFGLIAEDVLEILPELVIMDNSNEPFSVKYHELPVLLLNEIKKLREEVNQLKGKYNDSVSS